MTWHVLPFLGSQTLTEPFGDSENIHEVRHYQSRISRNFRRFTGWFLEKTDHGPTDRMTWASIISYNTGVCSDTQYSFEATTHIKDDWPLDEYCRGCNECLFFGVFYTSPLNKGFKLMRIDLFLWCLMGTCCNPRVYCFPQPISHDSWGFFKQTVQRMLR